MSVTKLGIILVLEQLTVSAPSRLHFGLFSVGNKVNRRFGGAGMMIDGPRTTIEVSRAPQFEILPHRDAPACHKAIRAWFKSLQVPLQNDFSLSHVSELPLRIKINATPPRHSGFGSGTQLALTAAFAVNSFFELPVPTPEEIAVSIGRGKRSAIGSHGFFKGGFLVDRGKLSSDLLAPLDFHVDFPSNWRVVTIISQLSTGLSGNQELDAFSQLPQTTQQERLNMIKIVRDHVLPGLLNEDLETFGNGIFEFGRRSGMMFEKIQNGPYHGTEAQSLVNKIRALGIQGVGQSSWGPCIFAVLNNDSEADELMAWLTTNHEGPLSLNKCQADNHGVRCYQSARSTN
jgi:beta-ribofuranosylaminobenzene 5'-phosphate synthase